GAMLPYLDHMPRLTVDGVVVARESWELPAPALAFLRDKGGATRLTSLRRLADELGLPRHVFVRTPSAPKPVYIDLESVPFCELLAAVVRRAPFVRFTEMLPDPDHCWLVDSEGRRYASEMRMVFVDPRPAAHAWAPE